MAAFGTPPEGACPRCKGPLTWGRVRYQPPDRADADPSATGTWTPSELVCLNALRTSSHPCAVERRAAERAQQHDAARTKVAT